MTYNPNEPRDGRGRWTDSAVGLPRAVGKELLAMRAYHVKRATGINARAYEFPTKEDAQAAANRLVRVAPDMGAQRRENYIISGASPEVVDSIRRSPVTVPKRAKGNRVTPTYDIAMAAGKDAANASMRKAGRTTWNEEDYNVMAGTVEKILGPASHIEKPPAHDATPINGATGKPRRHR